MSYNLHITRKKNYTDETGPDITADEWLAYVANDPELRLDPDNGPYFVQIGKWSEFPQAWLDWLDGQIHAKNPDPPIIVKMLQIATALDASVQGDDGEIYLEDPDKKGEFMVEQPTDRCPPFDPAPWNK
jgi:hypothetical protein